jgi:predicted metal-dependent peptidase
MFDVKLSHRDKIAAARGLARKRLPYFSAALFTLMPRALPGMFQTVGAAMGVTPRGIMYYDPDVVENEWDLEDVEFGLLHEVGHFLRDHAKRCEEYGYDRGMWNEAGDAAINDDLVAAGCKPLSTDILPSKITDPKTKKPMVDGLTEEAYYDAIRQRPKQPNDKGQGKARPGGGACGGVAGNPFDGLPDDGTASETQGKGKQGGRSQVEIERVKKAVAGAIKEHIEQHGVGSVPGGWSVWSDQQLSPPTIRWQDKLARATRNGIAKIRGMVNFHYERPSRRQWAVGYGRGRPILPAMYSPVPRVGVFVDTSGSMGQEDLAIAASETAGVLKTVGGSVLFGVCDAQVHGKIEEVPDIKAAIAKLTGGGGTNFVPVFEDLAAMGRARCPNLIVFLTDGGGPAPATPPPGIHVIWVLVGQHAMVPYTDNGKSITWGEQIFVPASGKTKRAA